MAGTVVGTATVEIVADLSKFGSEAAHGIEESASKLGPAVEQAIAATADDAAKAGEKVGRDLGQSVTDGARAELRTGVGRAVAETGASSREEAARAGRAIGDSMGESAETSFGEYGRKAGEKFSESAKESAHHLAGAVFAGIGAVGVGEIVKGGLEAADQLEGSNIKIEHIFGESAKSVQTWASSLASSFGISKSDAEAAAGSYANILEPLGKGPEVTAKMSESLVQLAANLARVNNVDPVKAQAALLAGIRGRTNALKLLGITVSSQDVTNRAYAMGLAKSGQPLSDLAKTTAAYSLIMAKASKQHDLAAISASNLKQKEAVLKAEVTNLEAGFGNDLLPMLTKFAGFLVNDVVPGLEDVGHWIVQNKEWLIPLVTVIGTALLAYKAVTLTQDAYNASTKLAGAIMGAFGTKVDVATAKQEAYNAAILEGKTEQEAAVIATEAETAAQTELDEAMDANPIGLVVAAIAALALGFMYAWKHSETFRDIVKGAFKVVKAAGEDVVHFFTRDIPKAWDTVISALHSAWNTVFAFIKKWGPLALTAIAPFLGLPLLIWQHWSQIKGYIAKAWNQTLTFIKGIPGDIEGVATDMLNAGENLMQNFLDGLGHAAGAVGDVAKDILNAIIEGINQYVIDPIQGFHFTIGALGFHHTFQPFGDLPDIPELAAGATVQPRPGGTLAMLAEAGRAETIVDTGLVNDHLNTSNALMDEIAGSVHGQGLDPSVVALLEQINRKLDRLDQLGYLKPINDSVRGVGSDVASSLDTVSRGAAARGRAMPAGKPF